MCGRFSLGSTSLDLAAEFGLTDLPDDYSPSYNIAPTQPIWAVVADRAASLQAVKLRWGLIPSWAKDDTIGNRMINARAETIAEKPAYREAFARRRCLIIADGFYEWQRSGKAKVPMRIHLATGRPFALAGIWERWQPPGREPVHSCVIITTAASDFVRPIHDRMPVILGRAERKRWLDPAAQQSELLGLLRPYVGTDLSAYPISRLVNSPLHNGPEVVEPV